MTPSREEETLEARLLRVEDRLELLNLEGRYARTWDSGDSTGWAEVFTEDGEWEARQAGTQAVANLVRGRRELEAFCRQCASYVTGLHYLHVNEVDIAGDEARGLIYFEFRGLIRPPGGPPETLHQVVSGYYDASYVRTPVGWRMRRRLEQPTSVATAASIGGALSVPGFGLGGGLGHTGDAMVSLGEP